MCEHLIVGLVKVLFVKVCVPVVVTTLADKLIVTVLPLAAVVTFVPPAKVNVSESKLFVLNHYLVQIQHPFLYQ